MVMGAGQHNDAGEALNRILPHHPRKKITKKRNCTYSCVAVAVESVGFGHIDLGIGIKTLKQQ
jgi:hypothetical protein